MNKYYTTILLFILGITLFAQKTKPEVLFTINNDTVFVDEFVRMYNKNREYKDCEKQSVDEYLKMYILFKQKVADAKTLKLDTEKSFTDEFQKYRSQILTNAMVDSSFFKNEVKAVYNRLNKEVNASHILINFPSNPTPKDTLEAYTKASDILKKAKSGIDFKTLAYNYSQDPSVERNGGNLGYFGVFKMVYPFEKAAFETTKGKISNLVRTQFGYHIIKVNDFRISEGQRKASHILLLDMANTPKQKSIHAKILIDSIYNLLLEGKNFGYLASKFSEDKSSARNGGQLPFLSRGQTVPEFDNKVYSMNKINSFSKPFKTKYGWHIVKLDEIKKIGTFEEEKKSIENKLSNIIGGENLKNRLIENNIKQNFSPINNAILSKIATKLNSNTDTSTKSINLFDKEETLFTANNKKITNNQLIEFIKDRNYKPSPNQNTIQFTQTMAELFRKDISESIIINNILKNNSEIKLLLKEYYEGILMFNVMEKQIWGKAQTDSVLAKKHYENNKEKYTWDKVSKATIITFPNSFKESKITSLAKLCFKKQTKFETKVQELNNKTEEKISFNNIEKPKGKNATLDLFDWKEGVSKISTENNTKTIVVFHKIETNKQKTLDEAKGEIIAEIQNELEEKWTSLIQQKYPPVLNMEQVNRLKQIL